TVSGDRGGWFPAVLADVRAGSPGYARARAHRGDPGSVRRGDTGDESVHVCALPSRAPARVGHQTVAGRAVGSITHAQRRRMAPQGPSILAHASPHAQQVACRASVGMVTTGAVLYVSRARLRNDLPAASREPDTVRIIPHEPWIASDTNAPRKTSNRLSGERPWQ